MPPWSKHQDGQANLHAVVVQQEEVSDGPRSEALQERVADLPTSPCWIPKRRGTLRQIRWVPKTLPPCRLAKVDVDSGLSRPLPQEGTRYRVAGLSKVTARCNAAVRTGLVSSSPLHKYREPWPGFVTAKRQKNFLHRRIHQNHPIHGDASMTRLSLHAACCDWAGAQIAAEYRAQSGGFGALPADGSRQGSHAW